MAKGDKEQMKNKLASMGDKLTSTEPKVTVQDVVKEVIPPKKEDEEREKGFHLFIPNNIYWKVKETCVEERISMKEFINTLLKEGMIKRGKIKAE